MSFEWRGGVPVAQRITGIDATGGETILQHDQCSRVTSKWMRINNVGANDVRIFWSEEAFDLGVEYTTLSPTDEPLNAPIEATSVWFTSPPGTDVEILSLHRRG